MSNTWLVPKRVTTTPDTYAFVQTLDANNAVLHGTHVFVPNSVMKTILTGTVHECLQVPVNAQPHTMIVHHGPVPSTEPLSLTRVTVVK